MKIISVVGARPNFMKVAPIYRAIKKYNASIEDSSLSIEHLICHTGQHYDEKMSKIFFDDLDLPRPDYYLGVGGGTHAEQTARIMIEFEKVLLKEKPDLVIVVGDVNSTIACALTAKKIHVNVAHVEAGLRSFDMYMPEEINRMMTDKISDFLFVTEYSGCTNLKNEGVPGEKVFLVGNTMIDSLIYYQDKIDMSGILNKLSLLEDDYILVTFHRPSNVDSHGSLSNLVSFLNNVSKMKKVIFPIHPRTRKNLETYSLLKSLGADVVLTDPIGYFDFQKLIKHSALVITDSGGIQEETTYLGVPCITMRSSTERPVTVEIGTNYLVGLDYRKAEETAEEILNGNCKKGKVPIEWDGAAAERILNNICTALYHAY